LWVIEGGVTSGVVTFHAGDPIMHDYIAIRIVQDDGLMMGLSLDLANAQSHIASLRS
jgi:hypothetical protein